MRSIFEWNSARKYKKKQKEKEVKEKRRSEIVKKASEEKERKKKEEMNRVENFVDENIQEAFDTLAIYQKCLEDEKKKWMRYRNDVTATNSANVVKNLRKVSFAFFVFLILQVPYYLRFTVIFHIDICCYMLHIIADLRDH
jgi:hypothetical protein